MSSNKVNNSQNKPKEQQNSNNVKGKSSLIERIKAEITAQIEGQDDIIEFSFDSIPIEKFTPEINNLLLKYPKLISLEFNDCGLVTMDGFPKLDNMVKLCLEENKLGNDAIQYITNNFKDLQFLSLSNNNITSLDSLKQLSKLPDLQQLDIQENPVSELQNYRQTVFNSCSKLAILDNKDKDGQSVQYSEDDDDEDLDDFTQSEEDYEYDEDGDGEGEGEDDEEEDDDDEEEINEPKKKQK